MRWKGQGAQVSGNSFEFLRRTGGGGCKAENGVGVIVANWLIGKVMTFERFNGRVTKVIIIIGM